MMVPLCFCSSIKRYIVAKKSVEYVVKQRQQEFKFMFCVENSIFPCSTYYPIKMIYIELSTRAGRCNHTHWTFQPIEYHIAAPHCYPISGLSNLRFYQIPGSNLS